MTVTKQTLWKILQFIIFSCLGLGILYWIFQSQQTAYLAQCQLDGVPAEQCSLLTKLITDFKSTHFGWLLITCLAFTFSNWSRTVRWTMLMRELGYQPRRRNAFMAVMISYFTNLYLSRMGEVVRAGYLAKYEKMSTSQVMGTVILDRLLDVICMAIVIVLALILQFGEIWNYLSQFAQIPGAGLMSSPITWVVLGGLAAMMIAAYYLRDHFRHFALYSKGKKIAVSLLDGLKTVRSIDNYWTFILHSLNIWFMFYVMTWCCFKAFDPTAHLGPLAALTVYVFGAFGMVIPSPGGMGTYHALVIAALAIYGIDKIDAFSYANIMFFSVQIFYNVIIGGGAMLLMPYFNRNHDPIVPINEPELL
jgi:glycosyltransferase 2 family protein